MASEVSDHDDPSHSTSASPLVEEDDYLYEVEAIEDARVNEAQLDPTTNRQGLLQYKIRWAGYPEGHDNPTWESYRNVVDTAHELVTEFHLRNPHKPSMHKSFKALEGDHDVGPATHGTSSAMPHLPTELWAMVIDHVAHDYGRDVELKFEHRLTKTCALQRLGLVCREWMDIIQPLVQRHISFKTRGRGAADYLRTLIQCHERSQRHDRLKALRVESVWLKKWTRSEFDDVFLDFIPLLGYMQKFVCERFLSLDACRHIAQVGSTMLSTITLPVNKHQLIRLLQILPDFTNLTELSLSLTTYCPGDEICPGVGGPSPEDFRSGFGRSFQQLQCMKLDGHQTLIEVVLVWFSSTSMARLQSLQLVVQEHNPRWRILDFFLGKHGAKLTTFGVLGEAAPLTPSIFQGLPRLQSLELSQPASVLDCLRRMSNSVSEILLVTVKEPYWISSNTVLLLGPGLNLLSPESKLRAFRVKTSFQDSHIGGKLVAAQEIRDRSMKHLADFAVQLKAKGLQLLNEKGLSMETDFAEALRPLPWTLRRRRRSARGE